MDVLLKKRTVRVRFAFLLGIFLALGGLFLYYGDPEQEGIFPCPIYELTGFYCPGCGSGRAVHSLLHGDFYQAFRYNPLMLILTPPLAVYIFWGGLQWVLRGEETISRRIPFKLAYFVLAATLLYGVLRNLPARPFIWLVPLKI